MKKIITINDDRYMILGTASVDCGWTTEELKSQYSLADAVLRTGNEYYICSKLINAEWKEIA